VRGARWGGPAPAQPSPAPAQPCEQQALRQQLSSLAARAWHTMALSPLGNCMHTLAGCIVLPLTLPLQILWVKICQRHFMHLGRQRTQAAA
jgi:hypothetical protein